MVIIRINHILAASTHQTLVSDIHDQAKSGVIVLPACADLLAAGNDGEEIQIILQDDADRVAALETALGLALADLAKNKSCETCAHEPINPYDCYETGYACKSCKDGGCICRDCDECSKWEWRHTQTIPGTVSNAGEYSNQVAEPAKATQPQTAAQLSENRDCATCKHDDVLLAESCSGDCLNCKKTTACPCAYCHDGNRWEPGDSHGAE